MVLVTRMAIQEITSMGVESGTFDGTSPSTRVVMLSLTKCGRAKLDDAAPLVFEAEKNLFGSYSSDELRRLADLLEPIVRSSI
jgi:hypothetical protein